MTFTDPIPYDEAIAIAQRKGLLPNDLSSAVLSQLAQQLKQRAVFSAHLDKASVLQVLQDNLIKIVSGLKDERGVYRSIPEAKAQLREAMFQAGVPLAPTGTAKIKDFYSDTRRDLVVRTNVLDTLGFGKHVADQDPAMLFVAPAQELVRFREPKGGPAAERDWITRWHDAMDAIGEAADEGCTDPDDCGGRMVALKNHPIWQALGDGAGGYDDALGNPWAPFAFNSGMGLIDVARTDAVDLGIIDEDQEVAPDDSFDLNESLEASATKFSAGIADAITAAGSGLQLLDGVLRLVNRDRQRRGVDRLVEIILNAGTSEGAFKGWETRREMEKQKGVRAVKTALRTGQDAVSAMVHPAVGPIDFPLDKRGGKGLLKIVEQHGREAALNAPHVIAYGTPEPRTGNTQVISHEGFRVVLTKSEDKDRRHWMLTAYDVAGQKKQPVMNSRKDFIPSSLRSPGLHWPRPKEGALAVKGEYAASRARLQGLRNLLLQEAA